MLAASVLKYVFANRKTAIIAIYNILIISMPDLFSAVSVFSIVFLALKKGSVTASVIAEKANMPPEQFYAERIYPIVATIRNKRKRQFYLFYTGKKLLTILLERINDKTQPNRVIYIKSKFIPRMTTHAAFHTENRD